MSKNNLERMIKLAEEFFEAKSDPLQITVTEETMERLRRIHPATMTEKTDEDGPIAWMLLIPTTHEVMQKFISKKINEQQLLDATPLGANYDTIYLCSALVLPEHRRKGLARELVSKAISSIRKDHPIKYLFYWPFSNEGNGLAVAMAKKFKLPLYERKS